MRSSDDNTQLQQPTTLDRHSTSCSAPIRSNDDAEFEFAFAQQRTGSSSRQQPPRGTTRRHMMIRRDDDHAGDGQASRRRRSADYVPPPAFVVATSSRALRGEKKKLRPTAAAAAAAALTAPGVSSSSLASETSTTSSTSSGSAPSSSTSDDRIRIKWAEIRAKERSGRAGAAGVGNALALEKVVGVPGLCQGGGKGRASRNGYDDSSDTMMMAMMMDDASDATLKAANNNHSGGAKGSAAVAGVAAMEGPPPFHHNLYSTPIFTATLVEQDGDDNAHDGDAMKDPLEIMERAKAAARQEILRDAVAATVVIPIGDKDDDHDPTKDDDATSSKASSTARGKEDSNGRRRRCSRRGAILVAVLAVVGAAVAGAVVYFVSARSASWGNASAASNQGGSSNTTSASSATSVVVGTIQYGAASDEALGISSDGSVLAVGTLDDLATGEGGAVQVLQRSKEDNNGWTEQGVITDDGVEYFGFAIGMSGSGRRLVVGAPGGIEIGDPDNKVPGSVRVYDYDANMNMWENPYGRIMGPVEGSMFGHSVTISGDASSIAAGAPSAFGVGVAQVWRISNKTGLWEQLGQDLYGDVPNSHFGESTALSSDGRILVVGGCGANPMGFSGSIHTYRFDNATNDWAPLGPAMFGNASMDRFGWDVTVSGDGNVMAASASVFSTQYPGAVHVYRYNADAEAWEPYSDALVGELNKRFGYTVSLSHDGTSIAVGIPGIKGVDSGSVQVFSFDGYTHSWSPAIAPEATHGGSPTDGLGEAVALSSDGKLVAASSATSGYTEVIALN